MAVLVGTDSADRLVGGSAADTLSGYAGDDVLLGGGGDDVIRGGDGVDDISGDEGADRLYGGAGNDLIQISVGDISADGGADNDNLVVQGVASSSSQTIVTGGTGIDTFDARGIFLGWQYMFFRDDSSQPGSFTVGNYHVSDVEIVYGSNLGGNWILLQHMLTSIEVFGGDYNDIIVGSFANPNIFHGMGGNDVIRIRGEDTGFGDAGDDVMELEFQATGFAYGGSGQDTVSVSFGWNVDLQAGTARGVSSSSAVTMDSIENITVTAMVGYQCTILGDSANNRLTVTVDAFQDDGRAGITADGRDGDDFIIGSAGSDMLSGGAGIDTLSYETADAAVTVNLALRGVQAASGSGSDLISGFENLVGSRFDDILLGDSSDNFVSGGAGDDVVRVGLGNDFAFGGNGDDTIFNSGGQDFIDGEDGDDTLYGSGNVDTLEGGDGDDLIFGKNGNDILNGGDGNDTLRGEIGSDSIDGGAGDDSVYGGDGADVVTGGDGADYLRGEAQVDTLYGNAGADTLQGGDGADNLYGGAERDVLNGGLGNDRFVFLDGDFSGLTSATADRIQDFAQGQDLIRLREVDANSLIANDQNFAFIGTAAFGNVAGQLRYSQSGGVTILSGDTNGDGTADFAIALTGTVNLTAADFIL